MNKVLLSTAAAVCLTLSGASCVAADKGAGGAAEAIAAAKAAQKEAAAVGGEWRDVGKMIKKAEKLAADGKTDKAIKTAKAAEFQSKVGKEQSAAQPTAGPRF